MKQAGKSLGKKARKNRQEKKAGKKSGKNRQEISQQEKWLCRNETTLFCRDHIRFAMLACDNAVVHDDSFRAIPKAFLKFAKIPQNSLKFYVWLFVQRVARLHE